MKLTSSTPVAAPMGSPLVALSIRQPWAWLICHAGKDVENRTWPTRFRGRVLIHAGKGMTRDEYMDAQMFVEDEIPTKITLPAFEELQRGGIVGEVEIVECADRWGTDSPWFVGPWGFVLRNARPLPFHPCLGALGFFRPELGLGAAGAQKQVRERDPDIRQLSMLENDKLRRGAINTNHET